MWWVFVLKNQRDINRTSTKRFTEHNFVKKSRGLTDDLFQLIHTFSPQYIKGILGYSVQNTGFSAACPVFFQFIVKVNVTCQWKFRLTFFWRTTYLVEPHEEKPFIVSLRIRCIILEWNSNKEITTIPVRETICLSLFALLHWPLCCRIAIINFQKDWKSKTWPDALFNSHFGVLILFVKRAEKVPNEFVTKRTQKIWRILKISPRFQSICTVHEV